MQKCATSGKHAYSNYTPGANGWLSNPNTISWHVRPMPTCWFIHVWFCKSWRGGQNARRWQWAFARWASHKWKYCGIEFSTFFRMQIQSRDNTLFWLQIPLSALIKNTTIFLFVSEKIYVFIVLKSSHDRPEQIMPTRGIEPGTFQIFGLTLSQTSYRCLSSIARMPLNIALSNNLNNLMFFLWDLWHSCQTLSAGPDRHPCQCPSHFLSEALPACVGPSIDQPWQAGKNHADPEPGTASLTFCRKTWIEQRACIGLNVTCGRCLTKCATLQAICQPPHSVEKTSATNIRLRVQVFSQHTLRKTHFLINASHCWSFAEGMTKETTGQG